MMTLIMLAILQRIELNTGWRYGGEMTMHLV